MLNMIYLNMAAEAAESALKLARLWGYKSKQIEKNKAEIVVSIIYLSSSLFL